MKQLLGGILLAVGILIAGVSGLCSLYFVVGSGGGLNMLPAVLVIGGIPFALGAGLVWGGWAIIRRARQERKPDLDKINDVFE